MAVQSTWIKNSDGSAWDVGTSPNSCRIVYPAAATLADLQDTIENFITNHGWVLYNSTFGTNAKGYRALNDDGTTYKYMVLDFNTTGYMYVRCYESFTTSGGTYTNQVSDHLTSSYTQRVDLTNGGDMYIAAMATHAVYQSVVPAGTGSSTGGGWNGVFEIARDNAEDTGSVPCHYWATGYMFFDNLTVRGVIEPPRTGSGMTGNNASYYSAYISDFGWAGQIPGTTTESYFTQTTNFARSFLTASNVWNSKSWASDFKIVGFSTTNPSTTTLEIRGRVRHSKIATSGGLMDEASIKVDANGFIDPAGTATTHICFVTNGGGKLFLPK